MNAAEAGLNTAIAGLPPVSLAELDGTAALLTRTDRKYLVPGQLVGRFVAALGSGVRALHIDQVRLFDYDSVYFDTPDLLTYRAHLQRRRRRYKVRIRSYLDSRDSLLELKLKGARGSTVKERIRYPFADRDRLNDDGLRFLRGTLDDAYGLALPPLQPMLRTRYRRATLLARDGSARLTCDVGLLCTAGDRAVEGLNDHVLVEVKSATPNATADRLLRHLGLRPATVSKYSIGVAALYPAIRSNPWRRAVHMCFPHASAGRSPETVSEPG